MEARHPRRITRGMRGMLYVFTVLSFTAGALLTTLSEQTDVAFAWDLAPPMSAVFVGAVYMTIAMLMLWAARQHDWSRAAVIMPAILVVTTLLLATSLEHIEQFDGPLGVFWIAVYGLVPPLEVVMLAIQLTAPGTATARSARLPLGLRASFAIHAPVALGLGLALFAAPNEIESIWPWELGELSAEASGAFLVGAGLIAMQVAVRDDRADLPVLALYYLLPGVMLLLGVSRFPGDLDFADLSAWLLLGIAGALFALGAWTARLALREGRFASPRPRGGLPVEAAPTWLATQGRPEHGGPANEPGDLPSSTIT